MNFVENLNELERVTKAFGGELEPQPPLIVYRNRVPEGHVVISKDLLRRVLREAWSTEDIIRDVDACDQVKKLLGDT